MRRAVAASLLGLLCGALAANAAMPPKLTAETDPRRLDVHASMGVNDRMEELKSAYASWTDEFFGGKSKAVRIDFFTVPLTPDDIADLLEGDPAQLDLREYNSYRWGAVTLFVDETMKIWQVNMSLRGHACTVAWKPDELKAWNEGFRYDGTRATLKSFGTYLCDIPGGEATTYHWEFDLDVPVFDRTAAR